MTVADLYPLLIYWIDDQQKKVTKKPVLQPVYYALSVPRVGLEPTLSQ